MSLIQEIDFSPCLNKKNLLAFSAGVDSTALFFLLLEKDIPFDMAMVNYNLREASKHELEHAKKLATKYHKKIHFLETTLADSKIEQEARKIRYDFFQTLIERYHYQNLLTAHQLNDQLEWFLMQLTKGAGSLELLGMQTLTQKETHSLFKPLLHLSKEQLQNYLENRSETYFIDSSNQDESYKRNYFRHNFSDALIKQFQEGISRSFDYIQKDNELLLQDSHVLQKGELTLIKASNQRAKLYFIDKDLKKRGYILSHAQRQEIEDEKSLVIASRFVIEEAEGIVFISPCIDLNMDKQFKESCRQAKIPQKIRPFLYQNKSDIKQFLQDIEEWLS